MNIAVIPDLGLWRWQLAFSLLFLAPVFPRLLVAATLVHFGAFLQALIPNGLDLWITDHECVVSNLLIIALCRIKVMDDERLSDDLAAWACYRLDRLQPGVRMLHLYNSNGVVSKGVLLVRIKKMVSPA